MAALKHNASQYTQNENYAVRGLGKATQSTSVPEQPQHAEAPTSSQQTGTGFGAR